ncbi:MAG: hypothetical protein DSY82_05140 [Flavobacteriia bacterium]|nr:MAG: hypothetical protein DSY82_05140 [Flavobacteriia bacterium]
MKSSLSKILSIVSGVISIIAVYFLIRIIMEGDDPIIESVDLQNSLVSPYIKFATFVLIITAIIAVVFSLINMIKNPKLLVRSLISIGFLAVILVISYMMASDAAVLNVSGKVLKGGEAGSVSKWVSTGIWYSVILGGIAIVAIVGGFLKSLVSK